MIAFVAFPNAQSIVTGACFRALFGTRTNTDVTRYHGSATLVAIAHFFFVNCVTNAGHTSFTSTYFALLTNFKYKRMYDDPAHSTNILLNLKFVCLVWPYTFCQARKAVFCMWAMRSIHIIGFLTLQRGILKLCAYHTQTTASNSHRELWAPMWVAVSLWPGVYLCGGDRLDRT